jgi:hypothetical protein
LGFKPTIVEIDPDAGQPMLIWKSERKLHLPGAWALSSLKKRGIPRPAPFREVQRGPAPTGSPRPMSSSAAIVSARTTRLALELSGEANWDFPPRSTLRKSVSSLPLTVPPLVRPVTAWEPSVKSKWRTGSRRCDYLPPTLGVLPEFPTFNLRSEGVFGPDCSPPLSGPICVTNWMRRSQLALPADRSSRIQGLQTSDYHVSLSPQPAAWSTKLETLAQVSEPSRTFAGLNVVDSCRPASSRRPRTVLDLAGPLPAIMNPGLTDLNPAIAPSLILPSLQSREPNTLSLLEVSPIPSLFATGQPFREDAIPTPETSANGRGSRLWFAVRVPSPHTLETPTPLDISKRLGYVHAARSIRFSAVPSEVVPHPAGLPTASGRALCTAPDLFADSAAFRTFERSLLRESIPEISVLLPAEAPFIQRAPAPGAATDHVPDGIAESFIPHKTNRFRAGPVIQWTARVKETILRKASAPMHRVLPVPDCPPFLVFQNRSRLGPSREFTFATPTGASFATYEAQPSERMGELGGQQDAGRVVMPENVLKPWNKPAHRAPGLEELLGAAQIARARASFSKIALPEPLHSSFATDLRDRIFSPILPARPPTHLRPARVKVIEPRLQESRVFAPVGFRWQRNRKVRDRGAPWKMPTGIGLHPPPAPPDWPGPLSVVERNDRRTQFH